MKKNQTPYAPVGRDFAGTLCDCYSLCPVKQENKDISICIYWNCPSFDFKVCSKYRPLKVGDIALPSKGERPAYCGRPFVYAISMTFDARKDLNSHCNTITCSGCGFLVEQQHIFDLAVKIWAYSIKTGEFPSWGFASMDLNKGVSVKAIRNFRQNLIRRFKKWGVTAGDTIFHPYRIKEAVQLAIRRMLKINRGVDGDSEAFWKFLRDDHKEGHLEKLSAFMGIEINSMSLSQKLI